MEEIHKLKTFTALDCILSAIDKKYNRDLLKEECEQIANERFCIRDFWRGEKSWKTISPLTQRLWVWISFDVQNPPFEQMLQGWYFTDRFGPFIDSEQAVL